MIEVSTIPVSTATQQNLLVDITECLCKRVCVNNGDNLSGSVTFSNGTPIVTNDVAIVPIIATGSIVLANGCKNTTRAFVEKFYIPFTATTDNTITLTKGANNVVTFADVKCCHTDKARLTTTLTVAIA